jgi:hypothetical protein
MHSYVDGARWLPPKEWDPQGAMRLDFGGDQKPIDAMCSEVSEGWVCLLCAFSSFFAVWILVEVWTSIGRSCLNLELG